MDASEETDVVVVGAGLAGLRCATRIAESGLGVTVLEAADVVGGRQRTDEVDGFRLDRGFQVLNPAYPGVRRWVDVDALDLQRFPVGVEVRRVGRADVAVLAHPLRHPGMLPATLRSGLAAPRDVAALVRWLAPAIVRPRSVIAGPDRTLAEAWDRVGLRGPLRAEVLEPFLAGVLADDRGDTSDAFVRLLMRMFALGRPGLPAAGIGALPAQLADVARAAGVQVRTDAEVVRVLSGGPATGRGRVRVELAGGGGVEASAVVVAVGPEALTGLVDVPAPPTRGLQTWWFAADEPPTPSAMLAVDGRRNGPIVNAVVLSHTVPGSAPAGVHLISATNLLPAAARSDPGAAPTEADVRRHLGEIWATDASAWRLLRRDDLHDALPAQLPPLSIRRPARIGGGRYTAGDHRDTASIQGALVSGDRVGRAVVRDLGVATTHGDVA
ncbi:FAD-dependent oxidoreductase [Agromyces bracchium]|uniref:NAD(P)-binding protein n=1 Tax=Agromyces bracchium TaxID=88376 RepID=A0A6I3M5N2_9MICO|nr:FAD-dependent oxidoreductase [Agromyces bracchium]MTH68068.1 NAD(P)-binding protein [Agromyces bracchium]